MKLFVSWSKETSHSVALALREWLPLIIPSVEPWVSSEDIAKGTRGRDAIVRELSGTGQGVICLTKENVREPWLNFEAGALSNHPEKPRVRTVLFDLKVSDVVGPLSDFQHTDLNDQEDVWKLVQSINAESDTKLNEAQLRIYFDSFWDRLSDRLEHIRKAQPPSQAHPQEEDSDSAPDRTQEQVTEEILERIRTVERRQRMMSGDVRLLRRISEDIAASVGVARRSGTEDLGPAGTLKINYVIDLEHGVGRIANASEDFVTVEFPDGRTRKIPTKDLRNYVVADTAERARYEYERLLTASDIAVARRDDDDEPTS